MVACDLDHELRAQFDAMAEWILSDAGVKQAERQLGWNRITTGLADDLRGQTLLKLWKTCHRRQSAGDGPFEALQPEAYAARAMKNAWLDLLRQHKRGPTLVPLPEARDDQAPKEISSPGVPLDEVVLGTAMGEELETACRTQIALLLASDPKHVPAGACALSRLTFSCHPVSIPPEVPSAMAGSDSVEWVALWAGLPEPPFPPVGQADTAAVRQRRSRALRAMRSLLAKAAEGAGIPTVGGGGRP